MNQSQDGSAQGAGRNNGGDRYPLWGSSAGRSGDTDQTSADESSLRLGTIPIQPGELIQEEYERPLSAPPPPGFAAGPEERNKIAENLLWGGGSSHSKPLYGSSSEANNNQSSAGDRLSGLSNLADMLGKGLADSMEDSTRERERDNTSMYKDDLNFHRQTRHAATRLVGSYEARADLYADANKGQAPPSLYDSNLKRDSSGLLSILATPTRKGPVDGHDSHDPARRSNEELAQRRLPDDMLKARGIGMNVMEPDSPADFGGISGIVSQRLETRNNFKTGELLQGFSQIQQTDSFQPQDVSGHIWSPNAREFKPQGRSRGSDDHSIANSSISESAAGTEISARQAEYELRPFLWDLDRNTPSRTLAVLRVSWLRASDVRQACEAYGAIDSFRADFSHQGVYFISYYDIRSAQFAAVELEAVLQRLMLQQRSNEEVLVRYCLPLNASSQFDESQLTIANLPHHVDQNALVSVLNTYGAVRSVLFQPAGSFIVEFQNIQDCKQALLELESSQPWGFDVTVEVGVRNPIERKRGRELLSLLSRWRQSIGRPPADRELEKSQFSTGQNNPWSATGAASVGQKPGLTPINLAGGVSGGFGGPQAQVSNAPQLVLGPDGRYQVIQAQQSTGLQFSQQNTMGRTLQPLAQQQTQQIVQGPDGQLYLATIPVHNSNAFMPQTTQLLPIQTGNFAAQGAAGGNFVQSGRTAATPYYAHVVTTDAGSINSGRSSRSYGSSMKDDGDNRHLMLDLEAVEHDLDTRTSLMVRNIPNKYTQQMLLDEFHESGLGPGIIDFFYLPIDFKNRCNRGYAFINFVEYKDIITFHRQYFGKHWRIFNSDKICDITYARIQGKAAMLKRFENSALMEKDEEYKPLVFVSDGPNKGQRLPFPGPQASKPPSVAG